MNETARRRASVRRQRRSIEWDREEESECPWIRGCLGFTGRLSLTTFSDYFSSLSRHSRCDLSPIRCSVSPTLSCFPFHFSCHVVSSKKQTWNICEILPAHALLSTASSNTERVLVPLTRQPRPARMMCLSPLSHSLFWNDFY